MGDGEKGADALTVVLDQCWKASGLPAKVVADRLGIDYSHFMRMMNPYDSRAFPPDLIGELMRVCGNVLPLEWLAGQMGYALHEKSLGDVLVEIRDAMVKEGKPVKFAIFPSGRVEPL